MIGKLLGLLITSQAAVNGWWIYAVSPNLHGTPVILLPVLSTGLVFILLGIICVDLSEG